MGAGYRHRVGNARPGNQPAQRGREVLERRRRSALRSLPRRWTRLVHVLMAFALLIHLLPPALVAGQGIGPVPAPTPDIGLPGNAELDDLDDLERITPQLNTIVSTTAVFPIRGPVEMRGEDSTVWIEAVGGSPLVAGMGVRTGRGGYALVVFRDGTTLSLASETEIEIVLNSEDDEADLRLADFAARTEDDLSVDETLIDDLMVAGYIDGTIDEDDDEGEAMPDLDDGPDDEELQGLQALWSSLLALLPRPLTLRAPALPGAVIPAAARAQDASATGVGLPTITLEDLDLDADEEVERNESLDEEPDPDEETSPSAVLADLDMGATERPMQDGTQVAVAVTRGSVWARVEAQVDFTSLFTFDVPGGTVSTRGATLLVQVSPDRSTTLRVTTGTAVAEAQQSEVVVAAGQQTSLVPGTPPAALAEVPPPTRALRLTLTTPDVLYVCDPIGRCAGLLPVLGVPAIIPVAHIPGAYYSGPAADVHTLIIPDPLDAYTVVVQGNGGQPGDLGAQFHLEAAGLTNGAVTSAEAYTSILYEGMRVQTGFTVGTGPDGSVQVGTLAEPIVADQLAEAEQGALVGLVPGVRVLTAVQFMMLMQNAELLPAEDSHDTAPSDEAVDLGNGFAQSYRLLPDGTRVPDGQPWPIDDFLPDGATMRILAQYGPPGAPPAFLHKKVLNAVKSVGNKVVGVAATAIGKVAQTKVGHAILKVADKALNGQNPISKFVKNTVGNVARKVGGAIIGEQNVKKIETAVNTVVKKVNQVTQKIENVCCPWASLPRDLAKAVKIAAKDPKQAESAFRKVGEKAVDVGVDFAFGAAVSAACPPCGVAHQAYGYVANAQDEFGVRLLPSGVRSFLEDGDLVEATDRAAQSVIQKRLEKAMRGPYNVLPANERAKVLSAMPLTQRAQTLSLFTPHVSASTLSRMAAGVRAQTLQTLPAAKRGKVLGAMPAAQQTTLLAKLPARQRAQLVSQLPPQQGATAVALLPAKLQASTINNLPAARREAFSQTVAAVRALAQAAARARAAERRTLAAAGGQTPQSLQALLARRRQADARNRATHQATLATIVQKQGARMAQKTPEQRAAAFAVVKQARAATVSSLAGRAFRAAVRPPEMRTAKLGENLLTTALSRTLEEERVAMAREEQRRIDSLPPVIKAARTQKLQQRLNRARQMAAAGQRHFTLERLAILQRSAEVAGRRALDLPVANLATLRQLTLQQAQATVRPPAPPVPVVAGIPIFPESLAAIAISEAGPGAPITGAPGIAGAPAAPPPQPPTATPVRTATVTRTATPVPAASDDSGPPAPTATSTPTATPTFTTTATPTPTATPTFTTTATPLPTYTPYPTYTPLPTYTPFPSATATPAACTSNCLYWTDYSSNRIRRAPASGGTAETLISSGLTNPFGIAIDAAGGKMYLADGNAPAIKRANLDGTGVENLVTTGLGRPIGIAVDGAGGKVYWTDEGNSTIKRANVDGTSVETLVSSGLNSPQQIALDLVAGKMYWASRDKIQRANLDGTSVEDLVTTGLTFGEGLALDGAGKMYWTDIQGATIKRANIDGTSVETLIASGLSRPAGLVISTTAGKMYWADNQANKIQRANLDGSSVQDVAITGTGSPFGLAFGPGTQAAAYQGAVLSDSPYAYWRLNETSGTTATDASGNGRHGTYTGGVTLGVTTGVTRGGSAVSFDGTNDAITTTIDAQPSAMVSTTWEAWVYPTRLNHPTYNQPIMCIDNFAGAVARCVFIEANTSNYGIFTGATSGPNVIWRPATATANTWQHIAVVYTASDIKFYLNGQEFSFGSAPTPRTTTQSLNLGRNPGAGAGTEYFQGRLDEAAVYNYALTAAQIQAHYNAGVAGGGVVSSSVNVSAMVVTASATSTPSFAATSTPTTTPTATPAATTTPTATPAATTTPTATPAASSTATATATPAATATHTSVATATLASTAAATATGTPTATTTPSAPATTTTTPAATSTPG